MEKRKIARGYKNEITFFGMLTDIFKTERSIQIGLAVSHEDNPLGNDYPKITYYNVATANDSRIDEIERTFVPGMFVKVTAHFQTADDPEHMNKNIPYQTIVGDTIEEIIKDYAPDVRNMVVVNGYVDNIRVPDSRGGMVGFRILTKRNYHDAKILSMVYTNDGEGLLDKIRKDDFIYTTGMIQTRRVCVSGRWATFEDYVVREIFRINPKTDKVRRIYVHESVLKRERKAAEMEKEKIEEAL